MGRKQGYLLVFDEEIAKHLDAIDSKYHSLIQAAISEQLTYEPDKETRNRKPLRRPTTWGARWELRFGPGNRFRVYYNIDDEHDQVLISAIGVKDRNRVKIAGEEVEP